jgi:CDP-2,3-bis-(O-geranylgeranyl)-sn-glycerol synthase
MNDIFVAVWIFLPAGVANMAPIFAARIPGLRQWNAPIDAGKTFRGRRIFGAHKTWRGLAAGMVVATVTLWLQQQLISQMADPLQFTGGLDYTALPTLVAGPLLGLGALGGDAIKSFCKRQLNIAPGTSWFPFDQIDYIVGGAIVLLPFIVLSAMQYIWLLLFWLAAHLVVSFIGYVLGLKEKPI